MIIVEHQDEVLRKGCNLVDERGAEQGERGLPGGLEQADRFGARVGEHRAQGGGEVPQKKAQVAIAFVERDPGCWLRRRRCVPGGETLEPRTYQCSFAVAGVGTDQCQGRLRALINPFEKTRPRHIMARSSGPLQFGLEQLHRSHVWATLLPPRMYPVLDRRRGLPQMAYQRHQEASNVFALYSLTLIPVKHEGLGQAITCQHVNPPRWAMARSHRARLIMPCARSMDHAT